MPILKLIPYPVKVEWKNETTDLNKLQLQGCNCYSVEYFKKIIKILNIDTSNGTIVKYSINDNLDIKKEGYLIDITKDLVEIQAKDNAGLLYAFISLSQLIFAYDGKVPNVKILDYPINNYRGLMIDVSRYFFKKEDIFKFADFCAFNKLNALHLHLTDDQGWRIEIDSYPLLTKIGSKRSHTNFNCIPHKGYYTKADINEIIDYCNKLNIQVIPEIDMPGHTQSALASYPWLGCFSRKLKVATHTGVKHDILCAGKETTYEFAFKIIDEIINLFGNNTKYIHIGGDEVFKHRWGLCPKCSKKMNDENLQEIDELQIYFINRIAEYVLNKGYIPIIWNEEKISRKLNSNIVWQYWADNKDGSNKNDIFSYIETTGGLINSSSEYAYLDLPYSYINLKKSYDYTPLPDNFNKDKLIGGEIELWTEYVPNFKIACKRLIPRGIAISEALWSNSKNYENFIERLPYYLDYFTKYGYIRDSIKNYSPSKFKSTFQTLWFERRQLHWQGLHNLIDDFIVSKKYKD